MVSPPVLADIVNWSDVTRTMVTAGVPVIMFGMWRWGKKALGVLRDILGAVEQISDVKAKVEALETDSVIKHRENSARLDQLSDHIANQESTSKMLAEVIGKPVQQIADVLTQRVQGEPT